MKRARAFTLLELLIVVLIMAIIAAIVVPAVTSNQNEQCAAAARALVSDLELAQSLALARQATVAVVFSTAEQSYKVVLADAQDLTDYDSLVALSHPEKPGQPYEVAPARDLGLVAVRIESPAFGGQPYVVFDSFGSTVSGGLVTIRARDAMLTIQVESITGSVSVL